MCANPCPPGSYHKDCKRRCDCYNGAVCDHVNGKCHCLPGYQGTKVTNHPVAMQSCIFLYLVADATVFILFCFHTVHWCRYWYEYIRHTLFSAWDLHCRCILKMTGSLLAEELSGCDCFGLKSLVTGSLAMEDFFKHIPNYFSCLGRVASPEVHLEALHTVLCVTWQIPFFTHSDTDGCLNLTIYWVGRLSTPSLFHFFGSGSNYSTHYSGVRMQILRIQEQI